MQPTGRGTPEAKHDGRYLTNERRDGRGEAGKIRARDGRRSAAGRICGQRRRVTDGERQRGCRDQRACRTTLTRRQRRQREDTCQHNDNQESCGDVPELLRVMHTDAEAKGQCVESAREKCHTSERNIRDGDAGERGSEQPQPRGDLARDNHLPEDLAALGEPVENGQSQSDPVINDVLVHPQSETCRGTRRQECCA